MNITQEQDHDSKQTKVERLKSLLSVASDYIKNQKPKDIVSKKIIEAINKELK